MITIHKFIFNRTKQDKMARPTVTITCTDENTADDIILEMFQFGFSLYDSKWDYEKKHREMIFEMEARQN